MAKKTCLLYIKDKNEDAMHNFLLTPQELLSLVNMPSESEDSADEPSHVRLYGALIDAFRLGEQFHIKYKNDDDIYIYPEGEYSDIVRKLQVALDDFNINNKNRVILYL